jgi:hypothetical protein
MPVRRLGAGHDSGYEVDLSMGFSLRMGFGKKFTLHGGQKRQLIWPRSNNFLSLVWNVTKLPHRIELASSKNPISFVFRFCYILAGK